MGPKYAARGMIDVMAEEWAEGVDTICKAFLGLTVACARCHDHKYDPIPTEDYYAMAGVLASTKLVNRPEIGVLKTDDGIELEVDPSTIHIVADAEPQDLAVFVRGNASQTGPIVPRGFLSVLGNGQSRRFTKGSGRKDQ